MANELLCFTTSKVGTRFVDEGQIFLVKKEIGCDGCYFFKNKCVAAGKIGQICMDLLRRGSCDYGIRLIE